MEAKAIGRYLRLTPRKARYVLDAVRGKSAKEALATLKFVPNEAARYIEQVIESAVANAEHNYAMDREILKIERAFVDQGPTIKRIHPRAMGRAFRILKRMCHITVVVSEDEKLRQQRERDKVKAKGRGKGARAAAAPKAGSARTGKKAETKAAATPAATAAPEQKED